MDCKINTKQTLISGSWLEMEKITYTDQHGQIRSWESVSRKSSLGAAVVIAVLKPSGKFILVRQFRPPTGGYTIEFPAGLIDNDESPEETALRELKEETGYIGRIKDSTIPVFSSPGLTGESVSLVFMEVDENDFVNSTTTTDFDDGEHIETFEIRLDDINGFLQARQSMGDLIDAKVMTYFQGLCANALIND